MPIDMAPPPPAVQGYQIAPPQSVDPLQTLSQMGQLKQQALQSQNAQMELQQRQIVLQDQEAMQQAMQQWDGKDPKTLFDLMRQGGVSAPSLLDVQTKLLDQKQKMATLDTSDLANHQTRNTQAQSLLQPVTEETDPVKQQPLWNQAVTSAAQQGLLTDPQGNPLTTDQALAQHPYPGPDGVKRYVAGLNLDKWLAAGKDTAEIATQKATTEKTNIETGNLKRAQAVQEIQAASDPTTGVPSPADYAAIRQKYPDVALPNVPTQANIAQLARSTVPVEKQPEFDVNQMKAKFGMLGNDKFDQFLVQYARGLKDPANPNGKTPLTLTSEEFMKGLGQFAELTADPTLRALMIGEKGLQQQMTQSQLSTMPTPKRINDMAQAVVDGRMAPEQLSDFRSGRVSYGPQVLDKAEEIAAAQGKPLDYEQLALQYRTRQKTEDAFATGPESQMVRSFNNLIQHLGMMDKARKALSQSDLPTLKAIAGAFGIASGNTAETTYDLIQQYVSSEASRAFVGATGGEGERATSAAHLGRNLGNAQIANNIKTLAGLADAQREGLEAQYARGTYNKGSLMGQLFEPQTLAARDQLLGRKPAAKQPPAAGAPAGATGKVPPPAGYTMRWPDGTTRSYTGKLPASDKNNWTIVVTK